MKLEIAITRRQKRAIVAASLLAVSLMSAFWVIGDACAACNVGTIKVPEALVGKDDTTPLALKDGEYLFGTTKTIVGPMELYVLIQKGQWAGLFRKLLGVKSPVLPDAPAPPEVEKCIASVRPTAGLVPQLGDFFTPSAEAAYATCARGSRCIAMMTTTNCFPQKDGTLTCYTYYYCLARDRVNYCYKGRAWTCRGSSAFRCPAGTSRGIT